MLKPGDVVSFAGDKFGGVCTWERFVVLAVTVSATRV